MKKIKRTKERVVSILLTIVMVMSLMTGMSLVNVQAADFYPTIVESETITLYESGCLRDITITIQADGDYSPACARIAMHNANTPYDWYNRFLSGGQNSWPEESQFVSKDSTFIAFAQGEEFLWTDCQPHKLTFTFEDGAIDLSQTNDYYIYLWTRSGSYGIYTDALLGMLRTKDGQLLGDNGGVLAEKPKPSEPAAQVVESLESWLEVNSETGEYTITPKDDVTYYVSSTDDVNAMNAKIGTVVTSDNYVQLGIYTEKNSVQTGTLAENETLVICTVDKNKPYDYISELQNPPGYAVTGVYGYKYTKNESSTPSNPTTPPYLTTGQTIKKLDNIGKVVKIDGIDYFEFNIPENKGDYYYIAEVLHESRVTDEVKNYETVTVGKPVIDIVDAYNTAEDFKTYFRDNYYSLVSISDSTGGLSVGSSNGEMEEVSDGDVVFMYKVHKDNCVSINETVTLPGQDQPTIMPWLYFAIYELKYEIVDLSSDSSDSYPTDGKIVDLGDDSITIDSNNVVHFDIPENDDEYYYAVAVLPIEYIGMTEEEFISITTKGIGKDIVDVPDTLNMEDVEGNKNYYNTHGTIYVTNDDASDTMDEWPVSSKSVAYIYKLHKDNVISARYGSPAENPYFTNLEGILDAYIYAIYGVHAEVITPSNTHTHILKYVPGKEVACTKPGYKEHYICEDETCNVMFYDEDGLYSITDKEEIEISPIGVHDWGAWKEIIKATDTTEGKREAVCQRENCGQKKTEIIPISDGEVDPNSNMEKYAEVTKDAPVEEVILHNSKQELIDSGIFEDDELDDIRGENVKVWLEVDEIDQVKHSDAVLDSMEQKAVSKVGSGCTMKYFEADLFKKIGNEAAEGISSSSNPIKISITLPINKPASNVKERKFTLVTYHGGDAKVIEAESYSESYNGNTGEVTVTFSTSEFSPYALAYKDILKANNNSNNSGSSYVPTPGTTEEPTTEEPTTEEPTTEEPTTEEPTTDETTGDETTEEPTTGDETTEEPTTEEPTTGEPSTSEPTTEETTTEKPTPDNKEETTPDDGNNSSTTPDSAVKPNDKEKDEVPKTGESDNTLLPFMLMLLSGLGAVFCSRKKEVFKKEN